MTFKIIIEYGEVKGMYFDNKPVNIKAFLHTKYWDKVNNVVTMVYHMKSNKRFYYTGTVTDSNYQDFISQCR